ncbi:MAG: hypothetical protein AAF557_23970 [Pseudomonadota bacterium]
MRKSVVGFGVALGLAACAQPTEPGTAPLTLETDLQQSSIASAVCTRGNNPAVVTVGRDGSATGRIVGGSGSFAGAFEALGPKTIVFTVSQGAIANEKLREEMTIVDNAGEAELRGTTFVCKDVKVRTAG